MIPSATTTRMASLRLRGDTAAILSSDFAALARSQLKLEEHQLREQERVITALINWLRAPHPALVAGR